MPQETKDLYEVLGVPKKATAAEIKKAYKRLARKFHPDLNPGDKGAEAKFKEISHAADVLGDKEKRKLYDRFGEAAFSAGFDPERAAWSEREAEAAAGAGRRSGRGAGSQPGQGIPFDFDFFSSGGEGRGIEDLFESLRGQAGRVRTGPGESIDAEATLGFADAVRGTTVSFPVRRRHPCGECGGSGQRSRASCPACRGAGEVIETERVKVKIPAGISNGAKVRVPGKGHVSVSGGSPGDLFVVVHVKEHPYFQRQGDDILTEVPVTVREAYLGAEIEIPTIEGPVRAKIPPGTSGGQRFRLRGRGVRNVSTKAPGDHFYRVNIVVPKVQTDAGRAAVERLEQLYGESIRGNLPKTLE
jgi:molecular chaperone DnaJ